MPPSAENEHPILFFDGVCGLCNRLVDRMLRWDRCGVLRFAPLQGETARRMLGAEASALDTIVLVNERGVSRRSEAVLRALAHLGGAWRLASVLRAVPHRIRDGLYAFVAARRYRWFGRRGSCRVPTPNERARFLD